VKALVLTEYNRLEYLDVPTPQPGPDDVLVEVRACGICGSDVHGMDGSTGRRIPPVIMGHEASGVVAATGSDVAGVRIGDRVTFDSTVYCGQCAFCRRGQVNLCDHRRVLGVSCEEYRCDGALAEYVVVPQRIVYALPGAVGFEQAAMTEPVSVALHAVRRVPVGLNDTAVVFGAGVIGLLIVQALRAGGCGGIIAVDLEPTRLDLACRIGADYGFQADATDVVTAVLELTDDHGADVAFEAAGVADTMAAAAGCLRKGGRLALVGNVSPEVPLALQAAVTRELTLCGSCASAGEYPTCLDLMAGGAIDVTPLISADAPLCQGAEWFKRLHDRKGHLLKVILLPWATEEL
jgi:L-iditol 2-dehydrogenase